MPAHRRVTPGIKFADTHLYTWVERGAVRVKCLAQEHNTMSAARVRTQTAWSGDEHTNHDTIEPPTKDIALSIIIIIIILLFVVSSNHS